ncbi:MAG: acetyl/propionyl/methylcrotonyl-CoA carboxylase subunit alpha [Pseudomonadota bacterium]
MITSLLIANRGEIACRIIRTARDMRIRTVAVYSDADAKALHVRQADEAVHIGPSPAAESYLVGAKIIAAAKETGAEAIHPGYGFLSENADFAQSVLEAGLIWVGPKPDSIRAMGLKDAAKKLMDEAGVPTTPGYLGDNQDPDHLASEAERIGYPVLIKAVAGGGGKGMRKVDTAADFADALTSCKREAMASFGNDVCLIEKWIESPRHIEVQIFGDSHGNVVHLFERDCSLQRRHQKVIEEAPAPGMDEATREAVCGAAVRAAKAVNYEGAGTIEFIADGSAGLSADKIWFMEMNTRLQVEHPVTEEITGVDLVEWQLRVAGGEPIPVAQEDLSIQGHAIEARLYAEDPASGFLPSPGRIDDLALDDRIRIETGVEEGDFVSPFYDPMIAKLVAHQDERDATIEELLEALEASYVSPLSTNQGFLYECLALDEFKNAELNTGLIGTKAEELLPAEIPSQSAIDAAARCYRREPTGWMGELFTRDNSLQEKQFGFRLNAPVRKSVTLYTKGQAVSGDTTNFQHIFGVCATMPTENDIFVTERGQTYAFSIRGADGQGSQSASDGTILSPMPGKIIAVAVSEGDSVAKGDKLVTLEAMKMEHTLTAPFDGTVASLSASEGAQVSEGMALVEISAADD